VSSTAISAIVVGCVLTGAVLGALLRSALPVHHLSDESKDIIKIGTGLIATLVALVLGLLVASAKSSFDTKSEEIKHGAAKIILLDRELRRYGPGAGQARAMLRRALAYRLQLQWGERTFRSLGEAPPPDAASLEDVEARIRDLSPANDSQRWLQTRALELSADLSQTRWLLVEDTESAISMPFLVVVVSWLAVIFASLGLFAPRNTTVWVVIVLCAISVTTAVFLILELDRPFQGVITLSKEPLRDALAHLDQ
jgi:Protein of unknown function (DUF4239)